MGNVQPDGASQDQEQEGAQDVKGEESACEEPCPAAESGDVPVPEQPGGTRGKTNRTYPWAINKGKKWKVHKESDVREELEHQEPALGTSSQGPRGPSEAPTNSDPASGTQPPPPTKDPPQTEGVKQARDRGGESEPGERPGAATRHRRPTQPVPGLPPEKPPRKSHRPGKKPPSYSASQIPPEEPDSSANECPRPTEAPPSGQSESGKAQGAIGGTSAPSQSVSPTSKAAPPPTDPNRASTPGEGNNFLMQKVEFRAVAPPSKPQSVKMEPSDTGRERTPAPSAAHALKHVRRVTGAPRSLAEKQGAGGDVQNVLGDPPTSSAGADPRETKKGVEKSCQTSQDTSSSNSMEEIQVTPTSPKVMRGEENQTSDSSSSAPEPPTFSVKKPKFNWITPPESPTHCFQFKGSQKTAKASGSMTARPLDTSSDDSITGPGQKDPQVPLTGKAEGMSKDLHPALAPRTSAITREADPRNHTANAFAWPMDPELDAWADTIIPDKDGLKAAHEPGDNQVHQTKASSKPSRSNKTKSKGRPPRGPQPNTKCPGVINQNTPQGNTPQGPQPPARGQPAEAPGNLDKALCSEVANGALPPPWDTNQEEGASEEKPRQRWAGFHVDTVCGVRSRCKHRPPKLPPNITSWFSVAENKLTEPIWVTTLKVASALALATKPLLDQYEATERSRHERKE